MRWTLVAATALLLTGYAHAQQQGTQNIVEVPADGAAGGANSAIWNASCPAGMVMTGLRVMVGGTCHNHCDGDGRPLATFNIVCSQPPAK